MENQPQETPQQRIIRFKDAIRERFNCEAVHDPDAPCDLSSYGHAAFVAVFNLKASPKQYPEAKKCYVWDAKDFEPGDNQTVVVMDVQVARDPEELPFWAVWSWLTDSLIPNCDHYVASKNWTKIALHGKRVRYFFHKGGFGEGHFFVRESADGKICIRIRKDVSFIFNGLEKSKDDSFPLTSPEMETIKEPIPPGEPFTVTVFW